MSKIEIDRPFNPWAPRGESCVVYTMTRLDTIRVRISVIEDNIRVLQKELAMLKAQLAIEERDDESTP